MSVNDIALKLSKIREDSRDNFLMRATVADTVEKTLNGVEGRSTKLKVNKVWVDQKTDNDDIEKQQEYINSNKTWADDLRADLSLIDKETGKVIDRSKNIKVSSIPVVTDRASYSIKGNEYQFAKQVRLKPGVYTKRQSNGEISSFFNVDKEIDFDRGFNNNFKIEFNPEKKKFNLKYGAKNVPLYAALKIIGASDEEIKKSLGDDVYAANSNISTKKFNVERDKFYSAIFGSKPDSKKSGEEINTEIKDRLFSTKLDSDTTKITLGKAYKNVNKNAILDASKKIIDINKGTVEGDDRESLIFKNFYGAEDHVKEKVIKSSGKIQKSTAYKLDKTRKINSSISSGTFDPFIMGTIATSKLSAPPAQTNVISMIGNANKFTSVGEGGIGSANAITNEMRALSNSEASFVDPLQTPEGGGIGITSHSTVGTVKIGKNIYSSVIDKKGKEVFKSPTELYDKTFAFANQKKTGKVSAIKLGKLIEVDAKDVDYTMKNPQGMFAASANLIPFLDSLQGNRGLTASKMQEQALSLKNRDATLFDIVDKNDRSVSDKIATTIAVPKSKIDGEVVSVTSKAIRVKGSDGKIKKHSLYDNFSLNTEASLHNDPLVKKGDKVKKGQVLADSNFTKDGHMALGANLRVAYMPYKGYNYEDSAIMSESAAEKLTSNHLYDFKAKRSSKGVFSKAKFKAYYPEELNSKQADKLDDDGVIKVGQKVEHGDILIAHMENKPPTADDLAVGRLDKQLRRDMANNAQVWHNDVKGVVTSVKRTGNSVTVNVKTEEKFKVADKISGLHGNKHIVSKIVKDEEMPFDPVTGKHIELTFSPLGVTNRINTSQILENAAGKIAMKTGKRYKVQNFAKNDSSRKVLEDLKKAGLSDKDVLINPSTGKPFRNKIANGVSHILKLEHTVEHKYAGRYKAGYDADQSPTTGGHDGAKKIGRMEMSAILARDGHETLKEMYDVKAQRNDDFWRAMETGQSTPPPNKSFVWEKQIAMMNGAGINVKQTGKGLKLAPMTDKDILKISKGEVKSPDKTYRKKDLAPIKGGLFDPYLSGGMQGDSFSHYKLPEKTLNPIAEAAAASITGLTKTDVGRVMDGTKFVDRKTGELVAPGTKGAVSGGPGMEVLLKRVNVDADIKSATERAVSTSNKTELNKLHKKIRTLKSLKKEGMKPTDYLVSNVLVTPSKYRPMFSMGNDGAVIMSDINDLYQASAQSKYAMEDLSKELVGAGVDADTSNLLLKDSRAAIYNDLKAINGLGDPTSFIHKMKKKKGFISLMDGGKDKQTKTGFFQSKVVERRNDLTGRSTITLDPNLGGDQIGIPEVMATEIFAPKIMAKIVGMGYTPLEAQKEIKDKTQIFKRAREVVAGENLVIANRAPSLHRWNMTAFKPVLTKGKDIKVGPNVISANFGGDYDGDTFQIHAPTSAKAQAEAAKMLPSASMIKVGWDRILNAPDMDVATGIWLTSKGKSGVDTGLKFKNTEQIEKEVSDGKLSYLDYVTVKGRKATAGMHVINSMAPKGMENWSEGITKNDTGDWIKEITKKHNGKAGLDLADKMKDVANSAITDFGFTLGVSDTLSDNTIKKPILESAKKLSKGKSKSKKIEIYHAATQAAQKKFEKKHGENTMIGMGMISGGSKGIGNTSAITLMPGIVVDADDAPIDIPITESYSEGLSSASYWAAAHGARGGNIKKSVQSFAPGWFTKDLMNSIYDTRIDGETPMDTVGVEEKVSDKRNIVNRYLAQDAKDSKGKIIAKRNDLVDNNTIVKLKKFGVKNVHVQSPLTDPTPGDSFSAYSYGVNFDGSKVKQGDHIGIKSAHTITEPSLNLAMKAFHSGGAMKSGKNMGTSFDQMFRVFKFNNNLPDKASLAPISGTVKDIKKSSVGGWEVNIDDKENIYIDPDRKLKVKKGSKINRGDFLTDGTASAHEMLQYNGMKATQKYLVDSIDSINGGELDRREIETVVRGVTNTTKILNPGSNKMYTPGDMAPLTTVEWYNNHRKKELNIPDAIGFKLDSDYGNYKKGFRIDSTVAKYLDKKGYNSVKVKADKIKHEPFLMPTGIAAKAAVSEDWIARLSHNRLRKVLEEGTTQGWESFTKSNKGNPLKNYITGEHN